MWQSLVILAPLVCLTSYAMPNVNEGKEVVRRQIGVGCASPGLCHSSMCMPVAAPSVPAFAPMPAPLPVAAPPAFPAYAAPACAPCAGPPCSGFAAPVACAPALPFPPPPAPAFPVPALAPPPPPPPAGRLIPQALPGAPCEPGVECTGGSVCSMGICLCPPELVQEGTVCVSRTLYGPIPGVPPPPPAYPAAYPVPARPAFFDPCGGIHKRSAGNAMDCKGQ